MTYAEAFAELLIRISGLLLPKIVGEVEIVIQTAAPHCMYGFRNVLMMMLTALHLSHGLTSRWYN